MNNLITLTLISSCLMLASSRVHASSDGDELRRTLLAKLAHTNPQQYYFLFLESETESPPTEEITEEKRSNSDEQPLILASKAAKRRMYARIGKRQIPSARVGR